MKNLGRKLALAMLLGFAIYGAFILYGDANSIRKTMAAFAWSSFALACGLAFTNYFLRFLKWEYYLSLLGIRGVPKAESFLIFLSGFVLTVTPGKVGEVFKSVILYRLRRVPLPRTAPIVVAERLTDLIGVIAMISIGSVRLPGGVYWASLGGAFVLSILVFVSMPSLSRRILGLLPRLPGVLGRIGAKVSPKLEEALVHLKSLTTPARLVWPTLLSICAWSLEGLALWVILGGFNQHAPLLITGFLYATSTLAGALAFFSPGGLGVTEKLLAEQMVRIGSVPKETATPAMLLVRFATLWFAVAVGLVALGILRAKNPSLSLDTVEVEESPPKQPADA